MHTFFINTSKKDLSGYDALFDIHYERKNLVSMACPMNNWYSPDRGYKACVREMNELIDGYVELNNAFNLILYVDLAENNEYMAIPRGEYYDKEREAFCQAMYILYTHVITESIVSKLVKNGREPQNTLIMFGQEKKHVTYNVARDQLPDAKVMEQLFRFLGLPDKTAIEEIVREIENSDAGDKVKAFEEKIEKACTEELVPGIRDIYRKDLELWCESTINEKNIDGALEALFDRIRKTYGIDSVRKGVEFVSCPYDSFACRVNKSVLALSRLNIALYVFQCVEENSVYDGETDDHKKHVREFCPYKAEEIVPVLLSKKKIYTEKIAEIESLAKSYTELGLAPPLFVFDHEKFGLDEYGDKASRFVVRNALPAESRKSDGESTDKAADFGKGNEKKVEEYDADARPLLTREEFVPFDTRGVDSGGEMWKADTKPEEYITQALNVRKHHIDYLKKLRIHVSEALSNYAGKSKDNRPALLQMGKYRYAAPDRRIDKKALESTESVAAQAYDTVLTRYMEFCAGRSVAVTDIEEQCDWFVSRVHQITESLKRIKEAGIGLLIAIIVLYIPFVAIQFEAIFRNPGTIAAAVGSLAIPIVILCVIFGIAAAYQKRKYRAAWKEFKSKSDQALSKNTKAAQMFDKLLNSITPALRWVYEYKLDVSYSAECCGVADAKIEHHRLKLIHRVEAIGNILGDLEYEETKMQDAPDGEPGGSDKIDYTASFCTGKTNQAFYSIVDCRQLQSMHQ